nr:PRTRC system ThiF family protein [Vibrio agarivorans]
MLRKINIAVIGCGGTGSFIVDSLIGLDTALKQLGHQGLSVRMFDGSNVTPTNLIRQKFLPFQVGENKAKALEFIANSLHEKDFVAVPEYFNISNKYNNEVHTADLIITCVDKPSVRYALSQLNNADTMWLDCGNGRSSGNVVLGDMKPKPQKALPNICDLYDYSQLSDADSEVKSCSAEQSISRQEFGVNQHCASHAISILWNLVRNGTIDHHGVHFDLKAGTVDPIKVCENEWLTYGYELPV